jgi:thiamine kinase-like enzyme
LAHYHRLDFATLESHRYLSYLPRTIPWILSIHQTPDLDGEISLGNTKLISVLREYPDYQNALDELRSEWRIDTLIHGDMKWDNCVVLSKTSSEQELKVRIVDWELADLGDACWDVGAILQAFLSFWIFSIQMSTGLSPSQSLHLTNYPLKAMLPAIRAFWEAYRDSMGFSAPETAERLKRSARYAAARMIQTAFESLQRSPQMTPNALCLLQVSMNILQGPQQAIRDLLTL